MQFFLLIKVEMPTIVGISTFMSMKNFMLNWVEHEKNFITSSPALSQQILNTCNVQKVQDLMKWRLTIKVIVLTTKALSYNGRLRKPRIVRPLCFLRKEQKRLNTHGLRNCRMVRDKSMGALNQFYTCIPLPWPRGLKEFSCLTQLSMKNFLLINVKMQPVVGITSFMRRKNSILGLSETKKYWMSWYFVYMLMRISLYFILISLA